MNAFSRLIQTVIFTVLPLVVFSQNFLVTYQKCDGLYVCGADTFSVTVQNLYNQNASDALLTVTLPTGILYEAGSVIGATENNLSNPGAPVFSVPALGPGGVAHLSLILRADCAAADILDAGGMFQVGLSVQSSLGSAQVTAGSISLETGLLLIDQINSTLMTGERLDTLTRLVCIKNTRLGPIQDLFFQDLHAEGFTISIAGLTPSASDSAHFESFVPGSFFTGFGDGDNLLEFGETVCFEEKIIITDCGEPEYLNVSQLKVGWGCGGQICRYDSAQASVFIKKSTKVPNLQVSGLWAPPQDYCGAFPTTAGLFIKNTGLRPAKDVLFRFISTNLFDAGIDPGSLRVVTAAGTTPIPANVAVPNTLQGCGVQVAKDVTVVVPLVAAGDTVKLLFDYLTCYDTCGQTLPSFTAEYYYRKECPPNGFVSDTVSIAADPSFALFSRIVFSQNECLLNGETYPFDYVIQSSRLNHDSGILELQVTLPNELTWSSDCPNLLGGQAPLGYSNQANSDTTTQYKLLFQLPLPGDSLVMPFCLKYLCDSLSSCLEDTSLTSLNGEVIYVGTNCLSPCLKRISYRTIWKRQLDTPFQCSISDCQELIIGVDGCSLNDTTTSDTSNMFPVGPGFKFSYKMTSYRTNLGLRDTDNDRMADNNSLASGPLVRRDRFLTGDTLRVEYCFSVDSGGGMVSFPRTIYHDIRLSDLSNPDVDSFNLLLGRTQFTNAGLFRLVTKTARVKYANGQEYLVSEIGQHSATDKKLLQIQQVNTNPPVILDQFVYQYFVLDTRLDSLFAHGLLPKGTLDAGDSLFLYTDFKLDFNFRPLSTNNPDPPLAPFNVSHILGFDNFSPDYDKEHMQYSGFKTSRTPNTIAIKPCENSQESKRFTYRLRIARGNLFPYEVRPLATLYDYTLTGPDGLTPIDVKLKYLALQDSTVKYTDLALPFTFANNTLSVKFSPAFNDPVDEGFVLGTQVTYGPQCQFAKPDSSAQRFKVAFAPGMIPQGFIRDSIKNSLGFYSTVPDLRLTSNDTLIYVPGKDFDLDFLLKNLVISPASHVWLTPVAPQGGLGNFELFSNGAPVPVLGNNMFQLSSIQGFSSKNYHLTGSKYDCGQDTLLLVFGWDCTPQADLSTTGCFRDTFVIILQPIEPEMELDILSQPLSMDLCDTSAYFEVAIFNAKNGVAYDLTANLTLPQGLTIVPGTCQISYPAGSNYTNIPDPAAAGPGYFIWQLNDIIPGLQVTGIPGVQSAPQNTVKIRFKAQTTCGFVANTQPFFGTNAKNYCGQPTNILNKPGDPLAINGLNAPYGVLINIQTTGAPVVTCGSNQEISVALTLLGATSGQDSAYITLPVFAHYLSGSYVPVQNATNTPPTILPDGIRVGIPAGLTPGTQVTFRFSVTYDQQAGCDNQQIRVQTRVKTDAYCPTIGANCAVYLATGENSLALQISHPTWEVANLSFDVSNNGTTLGLTLHNSSVVQASGVVLEVWQDVNGNGLVDNGDVLVQTLDNPQTVLPGASIDVSMLLQNSNLPICQLLIRIPELTYCNCSAMLIPVENSLYTHQVQHFCDLGAVLVGVPAVPGASYFWHANNGLSCTTCASATYTPPAGLAPGDVVTLYLDEQNGQCNVTHGFQLTFGNDFSLSTSALSICKGETITLNATATGGTFQWFGPGIQQPASGAQSLQPDQSGAYTLIVQLPGNCQEDTTIQVIVYHADTTQLAPITTCEGVAVQILGQQTSTAGNYTQLLTNVHGCDSLIVQALDVLPPIETTEQQFMCLGDTLHVLDTIFLSSGQVCRTYTAANNCDSVHCVQVTAYFPPNITDPDTLRTGLGAPIVLQGQAGFPIYQWIPPVPNCDTCTTVTVQFDSSGYYEYYLTVVDEHGCKEQVTYRIVVFPPCDAANIRIPNAFTPNGDQVNDEFRVVPYEGSEIIGSLTIYDRWGEKVYENTGNVSWDGTIKGKPAPSDVYIYLIEVICGGSPERLIGDVTLIR